MYTKPTAPRSIGGVLDSTFSLWFPLIKKIWLLAVIPQLLSTGVMFYEYFTVGPSALVQASKFGLQGGASAVGSIMNLVIGIITLGFYNAMWARADDAAAKGSMGFGESLSVGFSRWGHAFGFGILVVLAALPLIFGIIMLGGQTTTGQVQPPSAAAVIFMFAWLLVFIWAIGRLFLALPIIVVEDETAIGAIRASWALTRGHWWRCAAVNMVITIVAYIIFFVFGLVLAAIGIRSAMRGGAQPTVGLGMLVAMTLFGILSTLIFTPLILSAFLSLYYDLKMRKEGTDLAGRVDALGSGQA